MIPESAIQTQVAVTMLPKFNSRLYLPLFEQCGGIEGFFKENPAALENLCRATRLPSVHPTVTSLSKRQNGN